MTASDADPDGGEPASVDGWHVPWGVLDCVGVFAVAVVAVVVLANVLGLVAAAVDLPAQTESVLLPLPLATLAVVTLGWVHVRHRAIGRLTGPRRARIRDWLVGAGLGAATFLVVNVVFGLLVQLAAEAFGWHLQEPQPQIREAAADPALLPWLALSAIVVAPLAEELFFRGMLVPALRRRAGRWPAIVVSAVLFAAAHVVAEPTYSGGVVVFVLVLPLGLLLAWLFDRRRTLAVPIAVHAGFNAVTLGVMLLAMREGLLAAA